MVGPSAIFPFDALTSMLRNGFSLRAVELPRVLRLPALRDNEEIGKEKYDHHDPLWARGPLTPRGHPSTVAGELC